MRTLIHVVLVLASTLVALVIGEGIVRIVSPQSVAVPWQDEINGVNAPRPNVRGRHAIPDTFDVIVSFNSQRFRSQRYFQPHPAPGVVRIAALGDSFTFDHGAMMTKLIPLSLSEFLKNSWLKALRRDETNQTDETTK